MFVKDTATGRMPLAFKKHAASHCHHEANLVVITLPATTRHIGVQLSEQYAKEMEQNRSMLMKILSCIKGLTRQGLPLRGDGDETDGNFLYFLSLGADDVTLDWLRKKCNKYTSHEVQNEIIKLMAVHCLRKVSDSLQQSPFLTIMIDETTDISNCEQVTVVFRRIDEEFNVFEDFLGLYHVTSIGAESLTEVIKDTLLRLNISINKLRGQCYDGCSTMSGTKTGVAKRITNEEPRAIYTHCYGHSLSLAVCDTVKGSELMKDALDTTHEITKLIKSSPQRDAIFHKHKAEIENALSSTTVGIRVLCPHRKNRCAVFSTIMC